MTTPECAIGKELNPKTCRYIKSCRKGYTRNKDFKCVKNSDTRQISIPAVKEKVKLLKDLFSDDNGLVNSPNLPRRKKSKHLKKPKTKTNQLNGLENSPPGLSRKKSKHLKKTHKFYPSKIDEINVEPLPLEKTLKMQLEEFIERNGSQIIKMTFGEAKALARKAGFALFSDKDKNIYRDLLVDYRSKLDESRPVKKLDKVYFKNKPSKSVLDKSGARDGLNVEPTHRPTTFMFYSKSSDSKPGKGAGEYLAPEDGKFEELSQIKDWRKKLSNFWIAPFNLHGKKWASVEHYYQGSKFKGTPEFYNQFSLDSGSELSKDPVLAKAAGGKTGLFKGKRIRPKEIVIDNDFFQTMSGNLRRSEVEMNEAQDGKFLQNAELINLLKSTKNAKLVHYQRGGPLVIFENLMTLRSDIT